MKGLRKTLSNFYGHPNGRHSTEIYTNDLIMIHAQKVGKWVDIMSHCMFTPFEGFSLNKMAAKTKMAAKISGIWG